MPSCVVKCCRNNSSGIHRREGITFHLFPSKYEEWRNDLIDVIRESRGDKNWLPSKHSAICSAHYETKDFYITKGGLLRIVKYAVPTKLLYEPHQVRKAEPASPNYSNNIEELLYEPHQVRKAEPASPNYSNNIEEISIAMDAEASNFEQPVKIEQPSSPSPSPVLFEPQNMQEDQSVSPNISNAIQTVSIVMDASSFGQPVTNKQSSSPSTSFLLARNLPKIETATIDINLEQPLSALNTPMERRLKRSLVMAQTTVQNQKRKIKTLNQKIRRLVDRNKFLKQILKMYMKNIFKIRKVRVPVNI